MDNEKGVWKRYPETKPKTGACCLVYNERGYMTSGFTPALYDHTDDIFNLYNPRGDQYPLDVTHYLEIPSPPRMI